jgi:hypothetical protein
MTTSSLRRLGEGAVPQTPVVRPIDNRGSQPSGPATAPPPPRGPSGISK